MRLLSLVNIKQGTKSEPRFSAGNTLPLVQTPFGMASFAPQTERHGSWYYHPESHSIEGIRLTHQPSPWINDYGTFVMTPQNDRIANSTGGAWGGHRPEDDVLTPAYMKINFLRSRCEFEVTPSERGAVIRLSFADERKSCLSILPVIGDYGYNIDAENDRIIGYTTGHSQDIAKDFKMYFVVSFKKGDADWESTCIAGENGKSDTALHVFLSKRTVEARLAISYISADMALLNLKREVADKSFDTLRKDNEALWESYLSRVEVECVSEEQRKTFYTCLWRTFLFPHKCYELNESGAPVHYTPMDGETRPGVRYTDNGFWDTYRTVYPFFALAAREEYAEMLEGFVNDYRECGWLPRWISIGEVGCMPSTLIDAVIADAVIHGIGSRKTWEDALEGMLKHANTNAPLPRFGRNGAESYVKYGYVPRDEHRESVNLTLDAAYGDYCIAVVAKALGRDELADEYMKRSKNYANLFDRETGFMRGRAADGSMAEDFDPIKWGGEYTEASAWQSTFAVPHDLEGLAELMGGRDALLSKLDELFAAPPFYRVHGYGGEIHEMTEMAAVDYGQCAISNQPSFHLPYIYAYFGETEKAHYWVEKMCREAFSYRDDGFPGDEDNGTTSAWYIFSCLGLYPICPGKPGLVKIPKLVKRAKILGKEI